MRNRAPWLLFVLAGTLGAQAPAWRDPAQAVSVRAPEGSALEIAESDCGRTEIRPRGGVAVIDLDCRIELRNASTKTVRGAALAVSAAGGGAGGRGSVYAPSLHAAPGESFPVNVRVRLLSPTGTQGPAAEIAVDGALFADMTFAGTDRIDSRRKLTRYEAEARVDRERLRALASRGSDALRAEMLSTLDRQARRPTLEARLTGQGRTVGDGLADAGTYQQTALLAMPDAPIALLRGAAAVQGSTLNGLGVEVRNVSDSAVRAFEVEWLVRDAEGRRHRVGSTPFAPGTVAPGAEAKVGWAKQVALSAPGGAAVQPAATEAYVSRVEMGDGSIWKPSRAALAEASLLEFEGVTAEEQRLAALYRKDGLAALIAELERLR